VTWFSYSCSPVWTTCIPFEGSNADRGNRNRDVGRDAIHNFRGQTDAIHISADLLESLSAPGDFAQILLTVAGSGAAAGKVPIFGTTVEQSDILT